MRRLFMTLGALALAAVASAAIIKVPADQPTIQDAVNAANPAGGDTIQVDPGTYAETVTIDRQVILEGAGSGSTTIDATGFTYGILLQTGGTATDRMTIRDLRITGARLDGVRVWNAPGRFNIEYTTFSRGPAGHVPVT